MVKLCSKIMKNEERKQFNPDYETKVYHKITRTCTCKSSSPLFSFRIEKQHFTGLLRGYKWTLLSGYVIEDFSFQKQM